jgi:hypothetical protein
VQSILFNHIGVDELGDLFTQAMGLLNEYFNQIDQESNISMEVSKIIHISLCMIFIAHSTITNTSKELQKKGQAESNGKEFLEKVLQMILPSYALKQIAELITLVLDRIVQLPSPWLEAAVPLITWFTLHKNDGLVSTLSEVHP